MHQDTKDFSLGDAVVRPRLRTIEVAGEARKIDHKALEVLMCLALQAGTVVSKQQLFHEVWKQAYVSDDVLTGAISRLRRALGDEARAPRFIETVPSVGYRLIAPVGSVECPGGEAPVAAMVSIPPRRRRSMVALVLLSVSLASLIFGFALGLFRRPAKELVASRSLAVLPLENLTGDPGQAHFSAGMTEALITGLARQDSLRVVSRSSVRRFEMSRPSLGEIARSLGVEILVEGSVQRSDDRIHISARLIDVGTDRHLWAGSFDGELSDVFELQEQMVTALIRGLGIGGEIRLPDRLSMPATPTGYESYLRARYLLGQPPSRSRLVEAVSELEQTIVEEDDFVAAHIALAEGFLALGEKDWVAPKAAFARVRSAAEKALDLDESAARPYALLAMVAFLHDWDFAAAEERFGRSLALDPHDILARDGYSRLLTVTGRFEEALEQQRILRELNPLIYHQPYLAYIYNMARWHEPALHELERQIAIEKNSPRLYSHLASTYRWLGRSAEAIDPFLTHLRLAGAKAVEIDAARSAFKIGNTADIGLFLISYYDELEQRGIPIPAMSRAEASILAGQFDAALEQIEKAFEKREPGILAIVHSPDYDALREESRFLAVLRGFGLPRPVRGS